MGNRETYEFRVLMTAKNLWQFSLYHANKGYRGIFNVLFTVASLYLLITTWSENTGAYRLLMVLAAMMFTVLQPGLLYLKAKRQASLSVMKEPIQFVFTRETICVQQGGQKQELKWDQIGRIDGTRGMLVIYMDTVRAFLLPDEVMGNQKEKFCAMLKEVLPKERRKRIS